ncbi:MAG: 4-hydroxy-3-methylbut-2-enyl diphosphate reductase [Dehalococcoidia bacterium]
MEIELACEMGFCFGVRRAIEIAEKAVNEKSHLASLGAIVHNKQVVNSLSSRGMHIVQNLDEVQEGAVLIPSHGVGKGTLAEISSRNLDLVDATCPIVRKAQRAAQQLHEEGFIVVVFGESDHTEVQGLLSWASDNALAILDVPDFQTAPTRLGILSQTTQREDQFADFIARLLKSDIASMSEVRVYNTICDATAKRQAAALELAERVDLMLVIGGYESANTKRLAEICSSVGVETWHIESAEELDRLWQAKIYAKGRVGITAGASTPDWVINEVMEKLKSFS